MAFGLFRNRVPEPAALVPEAKAPQQASAGLAAGQNQRSYLIQSYARDIGGGNTVMMRETNVPIRVRGRPWGGFRTAYKL
ncbi:MAG TPA: hypothetical protein VKR55_18260 [Bradyrhizobium sp.]|uniref:hypothetical protein n=1 Tax=Bradyrhizobium sp. TaxID=376 RepID=UPI002C306DE7|nr:hypothetical protein [Bradyrhizobium sp.]HLZ04076.1 hypothetical protein [Bradyrhizobium sp.]